jgi:hypothetical protein
VLIYAKEVEDVSAFYEGVLGAKVLHANGEQGDHAHRHVIMNIS